MTLRIPRQLCQYIGSPDWLVWARPHDLRVAYPGSLAIHLLLLTPPRQVLDTTLCRNLAGLYDSYAASILPILETNLKVVDAGRWVQIDELLVKSWQASIDQRKTNTHSRRGCPGPKRPWERVSGRTASRYPFRSTGLSHDARVPAFQHV